MSIKDKQNYAVVENGRLLMCGRKFVLGALTLIIHDDEGTFWGKVFAIDEDFNESTDVKVLNENDSLVYFREEEEPEELTWSGMIEYMVKMYMHDRELSEEIDGSDIADWEYNNEIFAEIAQEVNDELDLEIDEDDEFTPPTKWECNSCKKIFFADGIGIKCPGCKGEDITNLGNDYVSQEDRDNSGDGE